MKTNGSPNNALVLTAITILGALLEFAVFAFRIVIFVCVLSVPAAAVAYLYRLISG